MYKSVLNNVKEMSRQQRLRVIHLMIQTVPEFIGFDKADLACEILIKEVKENNFTTEELSEILNLMNENNQFHSDSRRGSVAQIRTLEKMGINLEGYTNLKKILER